MKKLLKFFKEKRAAAKMVIYPKGVKLPFDESTIEDVEFEIL